MNLKSPPRYTTVPTVDLFGDLPDSIKVTLFQLHGLAWKYDRKRTPPLTWDYLVQVRGLKERQLRSHFRELRKKGRIRVEYRGGGDFIVYLLPVGDAENCTQATEPERADAINCIEDDDSETENAENCIESSESEVSDVNNYTNDDQNAENCIEGGHHVLKHVKKHVVVDSKQQQHEQHEQHGRHLTFFDSNFAPQNSWPHNFVARNSLAARRWEIVSGEELERPVGRPPLPGKGYRFYIRFRPGEHPPELLELLEKAQAANGRQREAILVAALVGGLSDALTIAEDDDGADHLADDLFDAF